ncbi:MAG: hypothetical protein KAH07_05875, partial [Flavobacteriaceae bacterium]|nr:hypothetical protein [Flavobacteriaceae bacterium]
VRAFSEQRNISHDDIVINQIMEYDQATNQVSNISIGLQLPTDFPTKYSAAIKKVINQCPVKRHLLNPPTFDVVSNLD